jgi:hypothetical protein
VENRATLVGIQRGEDRVGKHHGDESPPSLRSGTGYRIGERRGRADPIAARFLAECDGLRETIVS